MPLFRPGTLMISHYRQGVRRVWGLPLFFFNIWGEGLFWRGYIFPRQELAFGQHTWWLHGAL